MKKMILSVILILALYSISYSEANKEHKDRVDVKKEFYSTGELKSEIPMDNGTAYYYYKTGEIEAKAETKNGLLHGKAFQYYKTGEIYYTGTFINGKTEGLVREYYKNGNIKSTFMAKNNKREGIAQEYHENGNIKSICMYKNDKKEGVEKEYKEDGKTLIKETNYKNGKKHGLEFSFYENGAVKEEVEYINGNDTKNIKIYYDTGILKTKHIHDKKTELTTIYGYNENGKLSIKSSAKYGILKEGMTYFYNEDGSIGLELLYKNDELISGKCGNGRKLNNAELRNFSNGLSIKCY